MKLTKWVFRSCNVWKLSKELNMFLLLLITDHQLFIATSLHLLLPVIQTIFFFGAERLSFLRNKNPQKLNVIFLDQNRRNFTPQKLPVIRYWNDICTSILFLQQTPEEMLKYKCILCKYKCELCNRIIKVSTCAD